jgi:hypothetical protein
MADECFNVAYKMCEYYYIFLAMLGFYKTINANMQRSNEDQIRDVGDIFKARCKIKTSCTEPVKRALVSNNLSITLTWYVPGNSIVDRTRPGPG